MDINKLLNAIEGAVGTTQELKGMAQGAFGTTASGIQQQSQAGQAQIAAQGVQALEAQRGEMQAQADSQRLATALGTNLAEPNQILTGIAQRARQQALQASQEVDRVAQMEANSDLFSNPAGFFYDLLYGDGERSKRDAAVQAAEQQTAIMDKLNASTTAGAQAQNAIKQTITDASILAKQDEIEAASAVYAAQMKRELGSAQYTNISTISSLTSAEVNLVSKAHSAIAAEEQRQFSRAMRIQAAEEKQLDTQTNVQILDYYNIGAEAHGKPKATTIQQLNLLRQIDADEVNYLLKYGATSQAHVKQGGDGIVPAGRTPAAAVSNVVRFGATNSPAEELVVAKIADTMTAANDRDKVAEYLGYTNTMAKQTSAKTIDDFMKDPISMQKFYDSEINKKVASDLAEQVPGDYTNLYAMPDLPTLKDQPEYQSEFFQNYVDPLVSTEDSPRVAFDGNWLLDRAVEAVKAGDIAADKIAADIVGLSSRGVMINNYTKSYGRKFMLQDQIGLRQRVNIRGSANLLDKKTKVIDLTDYTDVITALNEKLAADRRVETLREANKVWDMLTSGQGAGF